MVEIGFPQASLSQGRERTGPSGNWYAVHTKPRQEFRALENLQNQGYTCFLPTLTAQRLRDGKLIGATEPLFPRYLFIRLDEGQSNWMPIRSTRGVSKLVEFGGTAARVPPGLIAALQAQSIPTRSLYAPGDILRIGSGPFVGLEAEFVRLYQAADGTARVMVLMEILAKPCRISFPAEVVRHVA